MTTISFTLPVASANNGMATWSAVVSAFDNGSAVANGQATLPANSSTVTITQSAGAAWTGANTKTVAGQFQYEAAS